MNVVTNNVPLGAAIPKPGRYAMPVVVIADGARSA